MTLLYRIAFLLLLPVILFASEKPIITIQNYSESVYVRGIDNGFSRKVTIYGWADEETMFYPAFIDPEYEKMSKLELFFKDIGGYYRRVKPNLKTIPSQSHFHTSRFVKGVQLKAKKYFLCTFSIDYNKLILFSSTPLFSTYKIDTAFFRIEYPNYLSLKMDTLLNDSATIFSLKNREVNSRQIIDIKAKLQTLDLEKENYELPLIRYMFVPNAEKGNELNYFNNWYLANLDTVSELNNVSKQFIDSISEGIPENKLIDLYYNYIHETFKYLDIQVGMGSFIPRNVNQILKNKQGDCKDLSHLLCQILRYKGYNANLALASTLTHLCDFDFPSLSSGNHLICTVKTDTALLLLDGTDTNHRLGEVVESLQGRTILVTDKEAPYYYKVPVVPSNKNRYIINLDLQSINNNLVGSFNVVLSGFIDAEIRHFVKNDTEKLIQKLLDYRMEELFQNKLIDSVTSYVYNDSIVIKGLIRYPNKLLSTGDITYLFLDNIPNLFPNVFHKIKLEDKALLSSTIEKILSMKVNFNTPIKSIDFKPFEVKNDLFSFNIDATSPNDSSVLVNYSFDYNKIWIESSDFKSINTLIDNFNKKCHEAVTLHR